MTSRTILSLGLSALVLGGATVGCAGQGGGIASAGVRAADDGSVAAKRAAKALAKRDAAALGLAEAAVAAQPRRADYRMLLGQSYLQAGRFQSARETFAEALLLAPNDGRVALNLALATIATGDWQAARAVVDAHANGIAASDRGLAIALAGDPAGGVAVLMQAARQPGADRKLRQNLALALALSGQWPLARAVVSTDMSPADVDARMQEWANFAQPTAASDQVASLLGVRAVADAGRPQSLALNAAAPVMPGSAAEQVAALPEAGPVVVAVSAPAPVAAPVKMSKPMLSASAITFAPRREVVQALPAPLLRADGPMKVAVTAAKSMPSATAPNGATIAVGEWFVQLGAFESAGVARDAWGRISRRYGSFGGQVPHGAVYRAGNEAFYRLSVGGFDRAGADGICRRVRAGGGACFVRRAAGDQLAGWARGGVQMASR